MVLWKDKTDKPLARLIKKIKQRVQINKIKNERKITTNIIEIWRIIRDYYKQLQSNKLDKLKEMDKFLETYNLLSLNKDEIESLNKPITRNETELVIKCHK